MAVSTPLAGTEFYFNGMEDYSIDDVARTGNFKQYPRLGLLFSQECDTDPARQHQVLSHLEQFSRYAQNAEFMDLYRDDGTEITVVPGDTPSVELRLISK